MKGKPTATKMEMETEGGCAYVVQAGDVDASTTSPADRWWISVAARVFPALATTSKAKRERKTNRLQLNGDATAATNAAVVVGDRITYTPLRVPHSGSTVISEDEATQRSPKQWLAVCVRQGMRVVYENDELAVIVKPGASFQCYPHCYDGE
jgi:23S rRNA-/tRNA-specific pseudouridylate synthase